MIKKRYIILALGIVSVLLGSMFVGNLILAQSGGEYDPWMDLNDDGVVDAYDLQLLALIYATSGEAINKTALLLELEARLNSLNATLLTDYYNITECNVIFVDASGDIITGYLNVDSGTLYVDDVNNRVGIGTTSPNGQFQVKGSGAATDWITIEGSYGGFNPTIRSGEFLFIRAGDAGYTQAFRGSELRTGTLDVGYNAVALIKTANSGEDLTIDPNGAGDIILLGNVGVGITDPATLLDVAGDIQAQILKADEIRLGSTEGESYIYFYEDGSPTGEYIMWWNTFNQFYLSDDVTISGTITIPTTTRYYSIPGCAWLPYRDDYVLRRTYAGLYTTISGFTDWYAPVNLPHGAIVTELRAWVWDNDGEDIRVSLYRHSNTGTLNLMAYVDSSGQSASYRLFSTSGIGISTIDNLNYAYVLWGILRSGDASHELSQVQIGYTIDEPLP